MTLSVGLGRITNDPEAPIRTRKALGRLSTPGLLVLDKGLTIDTNGRMVLRIAAGAGLSEDSNGLAVKLDPEGGITSSEDGLAVSLTTFGDITVNSIIVNTNAAVSGDVIIAGDLAAAGAVEPTKSMSLVLSTLLRSMPLVQSTVTVLRRTQSQLMGTLR
jgi:selenophosphate synthetase-related protein